MANRYVWEKFTTKQVSAGWSTETKSNLKSATTYNDSGTSGALPPDTTVEIVACTSTPTLDSNHYYTPNGQAKTVNVTFDNSYSRTITWEDSSGNVVNYRYLIIKNPLNNARSYLWSLNSATPPFVGRWNINRAVASSYFNCSINLGLQTDSTSATKNVFNQTTAVETFETQKDVSLGYVSSSSNSTYPSNGVKGDYWYVYKGYDSIDATNITCVPAQPRGGEDVTVTLTPSAPAYGGTIKYQWEYSFSQSGSWTKLGDPTTETSKVISIPRGTQFLRVRVQASDNMGFTSTSYTTSATIAVINIRAYIGIDGKARKIKKIYIGVNGKAREVKGGYVGVDGKARRWF